MKKLFSVKNEVRQFLVKYPVLRDSDERLMANIWVKHLGDFNKISVTDVLHMLAKGELPSYESISRSRRKIQEIYPHLRGEKWEERHKRAKIIRTEIVGVKQ